MGLGSHMAQEDPGKEERETRDERKKKHPSSTSDNTAYTILLCELLSQPQLSSTDNSSASSERGTLGFWVCMSMPHTISHHPMHLGKCQHYPCCEDKEARTQKVVRWLRASFDLTCLSSGYTLCSWTLKYHN